MPKTFIKKKINNVDTWTEIKSIFVKKTTGWAEVKNVFLKKTVNSVATWVKVFTKLSLPDTTTAPSIRTTNTGTGTIYDGPVATSPQYLNADLFGKDGVYTNYTSIFGRKFTRGSTSSALTRTTIVNDDRFTSAGGVTTAMRTACDEQYLFYELTVQNGSSANEIYPISPAIKMIKRQPALGAFTTSISGQANPGVVLTFSYNLENYYYNRLEQANSKIKWWRSNDTTASGTLLKEEVLTDTVTSSDSTSLSGSSTYTIHASDDDGKYIVAEIIGESSWTRNEGYTSTSPYQVVKRSVGPVNSPYRFTFGKHFYVSSNGHIGLDSGSTSYTSMSSGRNISVFVKDLEQYYLAEYSNEDVYHLYFKSYLLNSTASSANALDYQIKFYKDPNINYCDIYIVRKGSNVASTSDIAPGYYESGTTGYAGMMGPYVISQGTVFRVYFGGTAGTTSGISWTAINENVWDTIQTWNYPDGADDIFTDVTSATNQSAPIPSNTTAPTLTTDTGNFSAGSTITVNAGTWTNTNSYTYELLYSSSSPISDTSSSTKTLVNTNEYVIKNSDASSPSYYFRGRVTGYSGSSQTGLSAIALTSISSRSYINPTTTISVGTATTTGFTISGTAGPLSGFGLAYASVSEIQIYNNSQVLSTTITTGLPSVNGTDGTWSYIWTGGSADTTYYAKVKVKATDSAETTFTTAFSSSIKTSAILNPENFTISTFTKGSVSASSQGATRNTSLTWNASTNATKYRVQYQGSSDGTNWTTVQTHDADSDITTTSDTATWSSPQQVGGFGYYNFMRASVRAANSSTVVKYSGSTADPSTIVYTEATGTAPSDPTFGTATKTTNSISQPFTASASSGSNFYGSTMEYMFKTSSGSYPATWSTTTLASDRTGTISLSSLSSDTTYNIKMRVKNGDNLYSNEVSTSVKTDAVTATLYKVDFSANGATGSPSVTSVTQASEGASVTLATKGTLGGGTNRIFGGWRTGPSSGTVYAFGATFIPTSNITLYAYYGTAPTCAVPTVYFERYPNDTSSSWEYFGDYPTPSGAYKGIQGMQFDIYTTQTGSTNITGGTGTIAYPSGADIYPFLSQRDGTYWSFRVGSGEGSRAATTSARWGRFRVRVTGIDDVIYFSDWTSRF